MNAMVAIAGDEPRLWLDIPKNQKFDEWVALGRQLSVGSKVLNWWIGDWWAAGSHRYGERAKAAAEGIFGREFGDLANIASVCRSFETSRRREALSFTHHREVAALPPEEADALLTRAESEMLSTRELRRAVYQLRPSSHPRQRDVIDVRGLEPICAELLTPHEIIIELATSLGKERALTDRESGFLQRAMQKVEGGGLLEHWSGGEDARIIEMVAAREPGAAIAEALDRTELAVWSRIRELRRRGLLKRPRDTSGGGA